MENGKVNFNQLSFEQQFAYVQKTMQNGSTAKTSEIIDQVVQFSKDNIEVNLNELPDGFKISKSPSKNINSAAERQAQVWEFKEILQSLSNDLSALSLESKKALLDVLQNYLKELKKNTDDVVINNINITVYGVVIPTDSADEETQALYNEIKDYYDKLPTDEARQAFDEWSKTYCPECLLPDYTGETPENYYEILHSWYANCQEWMNRCMEGGDINEPFAIPTGIPEPVFTTPTPPSPDTSFIEEIINKIINEGQSYQATQNIMLDILPPVANSPSLIQSVEDTIDLLKKDLGPKTKKVNTEIWIKYDNFVKVYDHSGRLLRTELYDEGHHGKFE